LAVNLQMEGCAHVQFDACHLEEVTPDVPGEHRAAVTDDGSGKPVEPDDGVEGSSNGGGHVGVAESNKVRVF